MVKNAKNKFSFEELCDLHHKNWDGDMYDCTENVERIMSLDILIYDGKNLVHAKDFYFEKEKLDILEKVALFPGSIEEYSRSVGYPIKVIGTERKDKGVYKEEIDIIKRKIKIVKPYDSNEQEIAIRGDWTPVGVYIYGPGNIELSRKLIKEKIEALVRFDSNAKYGLPVKKD